MLQAASRRAAALHLCAPTAPFPLRLELADASALPFAAASFDSVVDTVSLCVLTDEQAAACLAEAARVLRPGGRLLLLEHSRAAGLLGAYQDVTADAVAAAGKGCRWNQDVGVLVRAEQGLCVESEQKHLGGLLRTIVAIRV
jgi:ubiquinone/menaquinone biosynthesis C-methylase UbiE